MSSGAKIGSHARVQVRSGPNSDKFECISRWRSAWCTKAELATALIQEKQGGSNRDENFKRGSSIHEHFHLQEEVYEVIEGELEMTIDGVVEIARAGLVAIVPSNVRHSVKALTDGRAIIVDYPLRREFA
jgi:mannose-6-phosphate isomerase-like protein (cupin superfamily)